MSDIGLCISVGVLAGVGALCLSLDIYVPGALCVAVAGFYLAGLCCMEEAEGNE